MVLGIFLTFVLFIVGLSFYLGRQTKTSSGYYAAGGQIHWFVNGIAFAGDYLSAASFLGICGMIATTGYDGFLYSIGFLAGWVVALFVIAEPLRRMGRYTFADAVDAPFQSRGIQLMAAISTLVVSLCYLVPQMVGAGVLVEPLLGLAHHWGVLMVGSIVIVIVATAGMASTTYVQFLKGGLLILFSAALVWAVCARGLSTHPGDNGEKPFYNHRVVSAEPGNPPRPADAGLAVVEEHRSKTGRFALVEETGQNSARRTWWRVEEKDNTLTLVEGECQVTGKEGQSLINGMPASADNKLRSVGNISRLMGQKEATTGPLSPVGILAALGHPETTVRTWKEVRFDSQAGDKVTAYFPVETPGSRLLRPGMKFKLEGTALERLDFASLMLALFLGTAALPHILIRYYTVPSPASARKSTLVAIGSIGLFYILTLFMGLGAMTNGVLNPADSNMAAPLLAKSFGLFLFAVISAIAFATVLGTVSGLIVAASGAVAHDLADRFMNLQLPEKAKITLGKISALGIGAVGIALGILFKGMNVSFLVGLAFAVAASANLPAIVMILFWKRATAWGVIASIAMGMVSSLALILLSPDLYKLYGLDPLKAPVALANPGIISIPLGFITLVVVSLLTKQVERHHHN
jgi:cation/acetate symporter